MKNQFTALFSAALLGLGIAVTATSVQAENRDFLNVSYDATREFYDDFNPSFAAYWKLHTGRTVNFKQSSGESGKQARAVMDGLQGDVVSLALANDIEDIVKSGQIQANWQEEFPNNAAPYTSSIVFVVRKGNPKKLKDWSDLIKPNVQIVTSNSKTGGLSRWVYLSAWGYALKQSAATDVKAKQFVRRLYRNVKVIDAAAQTSMKIFAERGVGDVWLTSEREALATQNALGINKFDIIYPSMSILIEPSVAIVDKTVDKNGNKWLAKGYINYLYSPLGQEMAAKHFYRPRNQIILAKYANQFPPIKTFTIDDVFGGWSQAQKMHFVSGAIFDQITHADQ